MAQIVFSSDAVEIRMTPAIASTTAAAVEKFCAKAQSEARPFWDGSGLDRLMAARERLNTAPVARPRQEMISVGMDAGLGLAHAISLAEPKLAGKAAGTLKLRDDIVVWVAMAPGPDLVPLRLPVDQRSLKIALKCATAHREAVARDIGRPAERAMMEVVRHTAGQILGAEAAPVAEMQAADHLISLSLDRDVAGLFLQSLDAHVLGPEAAEIEDLTGQLKSWLGSPEPPSPS